MSERSERLDHARRMALDRMLWAASEDESDRWRRAYVKLLHYSITHREYPVLRYRRSMGSRAV